MLRSQLQFHGINSSVNVTQIDDLVELLTETNDIILERCVYRYSVHCVLWIRFRHMDPHHFGNLDPNPENKNPVPDPHQIEIRIRIRSKVISWIRNRIRIRINLHMTSLNVWNMSLFEHFFEGFSLHMEARIWIRIRIRGQKGTGSRI